MKSVARMGDTVKIHFTCKLDDGSIFDSSKNKEPLHLTLGMQQIVLGFEMAVIGMGLNETKSFELTPDQAYGPYIKDMVKLISRSQFSPLANPEVGMEFRITRDDGETDTVRVTEVTESSVTIDANHPLAGKRLFFEVTLVEIIPGNQTKALELFEKGVKFQDKGELDEAINAYKDAIRLHHELLPANYNLAVALHLKGEIDKAIMFYQISIAFNPAFSKAHFNLGIALKQQGKLKEALESFRRVIDLDQDNPEAKQHINELTSQITVS